MFVRIRVVHFSALAVVIALLVMASPVQVAANSGHYFKSADGAIILSNVRLDQWYEDDIYKIQLAITPSYEELYALRSGGWPHVDLEFTILELDDSRSRVGYFIDASSIGPNIGSVAEPGSPLVFRVRGIDLEHWEPTYTGRTVYVTIGVLGQTDKTFPSVVVDLMSTRWYPRDSYCTPMPGTVVDGYEMCAEYGPRARLYAN